MTPDKEPTSIEQAAKLLGRSLCGSLPHVVGVSLLRRDSNTTALDLYVDIDSEEVARLVPREFLGYTVRVRRVGIPVFAAR